MLSNLQNTEINNNKDIKQTVTGNLVKKWIKNPALFETNVSFAGWEVNDSQCSFFIKFYSKLSTEKLNDYLSTLKESSLDLGMQIDWNLKHNPLYQMLRTRPSDLTKVIICSELEEENKTDEEKITSLKITIDLDKLEALNNHLAKEQTSEVESLGAHVTKLESNETNSSQSHQENLTPKPSQVIEKPTGSSFFNRRPPFSTEQMSTSSIGPNSKPYKTSTLESKPKVSPQSETISPFQTNFFNQNFEKMARRLEKIKFHLFPSFAPEVMSNPVNSSDNDVVGNNNNFSLEVPHDLIKLAKEGKQEISTYNLQSTTDALEQQQDFNAIKRFISGPKNQ